MPSLLSVAESCVFVHQHLEALRVFGANAFDLVRYPGNILLRSKILPLFSRIGPNEATNERRSNGPSEKEPL